MTILSHFNQILKLTVMKKCIFTSIVLLIACSLFSQNEITFVNVSANSDYVVYTSPKKIIKNINYVNAVDQRDLSIQIKAFQKLVANYDIKNQACYAQDKACTYDVVFRDDNNLISATYDKKGNIVKCKERYESIKLPYEISAKIIKENPGWEYEAVTCTISYKKDETALVNYKIKLKKDHKKKTVRITSTL